MPKLVQKSGYIKAGKAAGYMKYIATRERVEILDGSGKPSKNQEELIGKLLLDYPDSKELHEYDDYSSAPTFGSASAFITAALDVNAGDARTRGGYMEYIAMRPRAERRGEHGLFGSASSVSLDAALGELEKHTGNVWTLIYSLRREDAARLGYDNADAWRTLLLGKQVELANAMKIPPDKFRWYAAFHDEDTHPHIHMMVWSEEPERGYLSKEGISEMRSVMTSEIFRDELLQLYQKKDVSYRETAQSAREALLELTGELAGCVCDAPDIEQQLEALAESLRAVKGRKQYGYLKKPIKEQVDNIVDALAALPRVAECYAAWNRSKDELDNYYRECERERLPMSQQKEFRAIKNQVIKEAESLLLGKMTFEDEDMTEEPEREEEVYYLTSSQRSEYYDARDCLYDDCASREERKAAAKTLEDIAKDGSGAAAYLLGKAWRDGLCAPPWDEEAEKWFRLSAEAGNDQAQYALGKLLLEQRRNKEGIRWLANSADRGNDSAMYLLGKLGMNGEVIKKNTRIATEDLTDAAERGNQYAQYALGKIYLQGENVEQDMDEAAYWFEKAAEQGNMYAQFLLERMERHRKPSVMLAATRLLHHLTRVFRDNAPQAQAAKGIQIDRKRAKELLEKRLAMGHKIDDHEEPERSGPTMSAPW